MLLFSQPRDRCCAALILLCVTFCLAGRPTPCLSADPAKVTWYRSYEEGVREAQRTHRMLLIYFQARSSNAETMRFEKETLNDPALQEPLQTHVCLKLPVDAPAKPSSDPAKPNSGDAQPLLHHPSFTYMRNSPGLAVIDFHDRAAPHWHRVVTQLPFQALGRPNSHHMRVLLELPPGSLTQRTLIYAVRIHPESPASAAGSFDPLLAQAAQSHSSRQAQMGVQGHHQWDARFQQISHQLPSGLTPKEVCAESWPNEDLLEAAVECVHSWRRSSGHWSAVRRFQPLFGYDMKRGSNGIWYATGIFGNR